MTPEEIQAIPGITEKALESIQYSVNAYYGPYEDEVPADSAPAVEAVSAAVEAPPAEEAPAATPPDAPEEPAAEALPAETQPPPEKES